MDYGFTIAVNQSAVRREPGQNARADESPRESGIPLGWLVCNNCSAFGLDMALRKPETHIGREMDIDINIFGNSDAALHIVINFDAYANQFYLYQLAGQRPALVNGVPLINRTVLNDFDRIDVAGVQFIIVRN